MKRIALIAGLLMATTANARDIDSALIGDVIKAMTTSMRCATVMNAINAAETYQTDREIAITLIAIAMFKGAESVSDTKQGLVLLRCVQAPDAKFIDALSS